MWKCGVPGGGFGVQRPSDEDWRPLPRVNVGPTVRSVDWGGVNRYYMRIVCGEIVKRISCCVKLLVRIFGIK